MSLPIPGITPQRAPFLVEWAGDPSVAAGLLIHAVQAYGLEKLEAVAPWHEQEFIEAMDGISYQIEQNYGTIHVLSPDHLLEQLRPYWQDQGLSDTNFQVRQEADGTYLLALAGKSHTLTTEEWVSLLFDPVSKADLPAEWKKPLAACFPIHIPRSLDSSSHYKSLLIQLSFTTVRFTCSTYLRYPGQSALRMHRPERDRA